MVRAEGLTTARRQPAATLASAHALYVADTLGELGLWYRLARLAIVGGSLVAGRRRPQSPGARAPGLSLRVRPVRGFLADLSATCSRPTRPDCRPARRNSTESWLRRCRRPRAWRTWPSRATAVRQPARRRRAGRLVPRLLALIEPMTLAHAKAMVPARRRLAPCAIRAAGPLVVASGPRPPPGASPAAAPLDPGVPVICVGNLTMGGSGKTPVVRELARPLAAMGVAAAYSDRAGTADGCAARCASIRRDTAPPRSATSR